MGARGRGGEYNSATPDVAGLEVGTRAHLKKFREDLKNFRELSYRQWKEAEKVGNGGEDATCRKRWGWNCAKQVFLDREHFMVTDKLFREENGKFSWSMGPDAKRLLTDEEIRWNAEMIVADCLAATAPAPTAPTGRSQPVTFAAATPAAATAPPPLGGHEPAPEPASAGASPRRESSRTVSGTAPKSRQRPRRPPHQPPPRPPGLSARLNRERDASEAEREGLAAHRQSQRQRGSWDRRSRRDGAAQGTAAEDGERGTRSCKTRRRRDGTAQGTTAENGERGSRSFESRNSHQGGGQVRGGRRRKHEDEADAVSSRRGVGTPASSEPVDGRRWQ